MVSEGVSKEGQSKEIRGRKDEDRAGTIADGSFTRLLRLPLTTLPYLTCFSPILGIPAANLKIIGNIREERGRAGFHSWENNAIASCYLHLPLFCLCYCNLAGVASTLMLPLTTYQHHQHHPPSPSPQIGCDEVMSHLVIATGLVANPSTT